MPAAFFDFDHTLIRDDSQGLEIRYLRRAGALSTVRVLLLWGTYRLYRCGLIPGSAMVRACARIHRRRSPHDQRLLGERLYAACIRPRLDPVMVQRIAAHRHMGHRIVILSASVPHLVRPAAEGLGVDAVICTRLETDTTGRLTGRCQGPVCIGRTKQKLAGEAAAALEFNLSAAWAYSDHHADLPFLEAVGFPVAVNPTRRLARTARRRGWRILQTV